MRILAALAVVMVTGCSDGEEMVPVKEVCVGQAEAWCAIVDQCDHWTWPSCVQERTDACLDEIPGPISDSANNACLDILWSTELSDSTCAVESGAWWPEECSCTRDGSCI
jgi:hypothetical protein